ncbi:DNA-binding response regulator in two-component regulatory system with BasS [Crenothrix polyspora]|uniref:DNA-binding response regulator in two-component regulatory system with BasS n=1 Tax=Crenothrix polyspora TaxID=360316 RepID=A0A1R4H4N3_9GAMM|nr:response regulator [Crenothrix polyspora]SJM91179.1 DNA-binding response regulator in two-component regulatory system with BasS [Crenothrix polyspora]
MNILLVEDDAVLADGLVYTLSKSGYSVTCATTGVYAEHLMLAQDFDLIVLDLGLPDMDGLTLLRQLRRRKVSMPILILTARDGINDRIQGIEQGADDYMTKPFELRELEARIHALIRRCYAGFHNDIVIGRLALNTRDHQILADGQDMMLSPREYAVLEILLLQAGKVVCKERLAQRLSTEGDALADNAIEVYIHRVRKRIEPYGAVIRTLRGLGYLLETADA